MPHPVRPVDAATVILVRDGVPVGEPWQTFMVRRHVKSDFAADVYVFPGGKVDPGDRDPAVLDLLDGGSPASHEDEESPERKALQIAAIRELFEEAGVLLALRRDGAALDLVGDSAETFDHYRRQLRAGATRLREIGEEAGLVFQGRSLHLYSRWITPEPFPRRFDTWFFVAVLPPRQIPIHDREETTASTWISPADALSRYERGEFPLVFATEQHLRRMAQAHSVEQVIAQTDGADLAAVTPRVVERDGEQTFLLPGDEGYEAAAREAAT